MMINDFRVNFERLFGTILTIKLLLIRGAAGAFVFDSDVEKRRLLLPFFKFHLGPGNYIFSLTLIFANSSFQFRGTYFLSKMWDKPEISR